MRKSMLYLSAVVCLALLGRAAHAQPASCPLLYGSSLEPGLAASVAADVATRCGPGLAGNPGATSTACQACTCSLIRAAAPQLQQQGLLPFADAYTAAGAAQLTATLGSCKRTWAQELLSNSQASLAELAAMEACASDLRAASDCMATPPANAVQQPQPIAAPIVSTLAGLCAAAGSATGPATAALCDLVAAAADASGAGAGAGGSGSDALLNALAAAASGSDVSKEDVSPATTRYTATFADPLGSSATATGDAGALFDLSRASTGGGLTGWRVGCACTRDFLPVCDPRSRKQFPNACTANCQGVEETVQCSELPRLVTATIVVTDEAAAANAQQRGDAPPLPPTATTLVVYPEELMAANATGGAAGTPRAAGVLAFGGAVDSDEADANQLVYYYYETDEDDEEGIQGVEEAVLSATLAAANITSESVRPAASAAAAAVGRAMTQALRVAKADGPAAAPAPSPSPSSPSPLLRALVVQALPNGTAVLRSGAPTTPPSRAADASAAGVYARDGTRIASIMASLMVGPQDSRFSNLILAALNSSSGAAAAATPAAPAPPRGSVLLDAVAGAVRAAQGPAAAAALAPASSLLPGGLLRFGGGAGVNATARMTTPALNATRAANLTGGAASQDSSSGGLLRSAIANATGAASALFNATGVRGNLSVLVEPVQLQLGLQAAPAVAAQSGAPDEGAGAELGGIVGLLAQEAADAAAGARRRLRWRRLL